MLWTKPQRMEIARHSYDLALGYLEWKAIRVKDAMLLVRDDFVQPTNPLPEKMATEIKILRRELEVAKKEISIWITSIIQSGAMSVLLKDTGRQSEGQELLLEDFKKLGIKNKRLEDDLKSKKRNASKRIKLTESTPRELEET